MSDLRVTQKVKNRLTDHYDQCGSLPSHVSLAPFLYDIVDAELRDEYEHGEVPDHAEGPYIMGVRVVKDESLSAVETHSTRP